MIAWWDVLAVFLVAVIIVALIDVQIRRGKKEDAAHAQRLAKASAEYEAIAAEHRARRQSVHAALYGSRPNYPAVPARLSETSTNQEQS